MMNMDTIVKAYTNGFRTRDICCVIAAGIAIEYNVTEEDYKKVLGDVYDNMIEEFPVSSVDSEVLLKMEEVWDEDYFLSPRRRHFHEEHKTKTIVFEFPSEDGTWRTRNKPSRCAITIASDGAMSLVKLSGVDPTVEQAAAMVTVAAEKSMSVFCYDRRKRKYAFNITENYGPSGCCDLSLILYEKVGDHYKRRRYGGDSLHISMSDKVHDFGMYLGDSLEILNWCTVEDYNWAYYKMYRNAKQRLNDLGIKFSRPPRSMTEIVKDRVTYDPTR
jgi:hypothetical protein